MGVLPALGRWGLEQLMLVVYLLYGVGILRILVRSLRRPSGVVATSSIVPLVVWFG